MNIGYMFVYVKWEAILLLYFSLVFFLIPFKRYTFCHIHWIFVFFRVLYCCATVSVLYVSMISMYYVCNAVLYLLLCAYNVYVSLCFFFFFFVFLFLSSERVDFADCRFSALILHYSCIVYCLTLDWALRAIRAHFNVCMSEYYSVLHAKNEKQKNKNNIKLV